MFTASATGKDHDYLDIPEGYEAGVVIKWGDPVQMFPNWSAATTTTDFVDAEITAHGVSVIEIEELFCTWRYIASSRFNRRITGETEMLITGPAAVKMPA
jgi:secreted PhoX family phosphatase